MAGLVSIRGVRARAATQAVAARCGGVGMERIGFCMRLLPGAEAQYRERHRHVWPDLLADLRAAGARDYSIFIRGSDLFAYLEVEDFARFTERMGHSEANERWQ